MVSWAAKTPCIQAVAQSFVSSGNMSSPLRSSAPWRRTTTRSLSLSTTWRLSFSPARRTTAAARRAARYGCAGGSALRIAFRRRRRRLRRRILQQATRRWGERDFGGANLLACSTSSTAEIGLARRGGMIGLIEAKERPRRRLARRQRRGVDCKAAHAVSNCRRVEGRPVPNAP